MWVISAHVDGSAHVRAVQVARDLLIAAALGRRPRVASAVALARPEEQAGEQRTSNPCQPRVVAFRCHAFLPFQLDAQAERSEVPSARIGGGDPPAGFLHRPMFFTALRSIANATTTSPIPAICQNGANSTAFSSPSIP